MTTARKLAEPVEAAKPIGDATDAPAEWAAPSALVPWAKNPKPIEPKDVREMGRSIRRFGFGAPIVARRANGEVIEGHLRLAAALRLKLARVPVRYLDLAEDEAHMLAVAAIKFELRREADDDELAAILDDLEEKGVDLTVGTGFEDEEIDALLEAAADAGDSAAGSEAGAAAPGKRKVRSKAASGLTYRIVVECTDEMHQVALLEKLEGEGLECKPLIS